MTQFLQDILKGLQVSPKYLDSKYFYNKKGDELFQQIMALDEYYLTNSEMEILQNQKKEIANAVAPYASQVEVIEFGPGDATKSIYLLQELHNRNGLLKYFPIDISKNVIDKLQSDLPGRIPGLNLLGINGEYFESLAQLKNSKNKKLLLFLGANIGNFKFNEVIPFCKKLHDLLNPGDLVLIGFDLKKDPRKILAAYNDAQGITAQFNLNLLRRINEELDGNFDMDAFEHYASYDPGTGAAKSYLVSMKEQEVLIHDTTIHFAKDETIFMEISQKYSVEEIYELCNETGFEQAGIFFDQKRYFADVLWLRQ